MSAPVNDQTYLLRLKGAGWSDAAIAKKLGISEEEVRRRILVATDTVRAALTNGYTMLADRWLTLCNQYQLLGESLKAVGMALGDVAPQKEVEAAISENREETLHRLNFQFIILRKFVPPPPLEEVPKDSVKDN